MAFGAGALAEAYIEIRAKMDKLQGDMGHVKSFVQSSLMNVASVAGGILAASGFQALNEGLMGVAAGFIQANAQMEQYRVALGVMLKDQARANRLIMEMEQMARKTPFETGQLIQAAQLLKSYGFEVEKLLPTLRSIGDAAAASPQGMEAAVGRIALAIGQIRANGKVMGQEMNQLANAGVPAWEILAEQAGKSIAQVRKLTKEGAISGTQAVDMLLKGFDERFGGMMEKQSKSFSGLMSTMRDTAQIMLRKIGEPLFEIAKVKLDNLTEWLDTAAADVWISSMRRAVRTVTEFVSSGLDYFLSESGKQALQTAARIGAVVIALQGFVAVAAAVKGVAVVLSTMAALNLPLMAVVSSIGMLTVAFVDLDGKLGPIRRTLVKLAEDLLGIETAAAGAAKALGFSEAGKDLMEQEKKWRDSIDEMENRKKGEAGKPVDPFQKELDEAKNTAAGEVDAKIKEGIRFGDQRREQIKQMEAEIAKRQQHLEKLEREQRRHMQGGIGAAHGSPNAGVARDIETEKRNIAQLKTQIDLHKQNMEENRKRIFDMLEERERIKDEVDRNFGPDKLRGMFDSVFSSLSESQQSAVESAKKNAPRDFAGIGRGIGSIAGAVSSFLTGGAASAGAVGATAGEGFDENKEAIAEAAKALGISEEEMKAILDKSKALAERQKARQALIDRGVDPALLPGDEDLLGGKRQTPQFMALDQLGKSIQSSLGLDPADRERKRMVKLAEDAARARERVEIGLGKVAAKLPPPMGFKE